MVFIPVCLFGPRKNQTDRFRKSISSFSSASTSPSSPFASNRAVLSAHSTALKPPPLPRRASAKHARQGLARHVEPYPPSQSSPRDLQAQPPSLPARITLVSPRDCRRLMGWRRKVKEEGGGQGGQGRNSKASFSRVVPNPRPKNRRVSQRDGRRAGADILQDLDLAVHQRLRGNRPDLSSNLRPRPLLLLLSISQLPASGSSQSPRICAGTTCQSFGDVNLASSLVVHGRGDQSFNLARRFSRFLGLHHLGLLKVDSSRTAWNGPLD